MSTNQSSRPAEATWSPERSWCFLNQFSIPTHLKSRWVESVFLHCEIENRCGVTNPIQFNAQLLIWSQSCELLKTTMGVFVSTNKLNSPYQRDYSCLQDSILCVKHIDSQSQHCFKKCCQAIYRWHQDTVSVNYFGFKLRWSPSHISFILPEDV